MPTPSRQPLSKMAADLAARIRGEVFGDVLHRLAYSTDASIYRIVPQVVVVPRCVEDVIRVVEYAAAEGIPIAPRGGGSGVAGESLCEGIVLDMTRHLRGIVQVGPGGASVVCEPGVVLEALNSHLAPWGRKVGPDPSSGNRATLGGCVANNATGAHSLQYGYMADHVDAVEAVLADGRAVAWTRAVPLGDDLVIRCHHILTDNRRTIEMAQPMSRRNRSGYTVAGVCHEDKIDMARLLSGSEGTLGIFTRMTLRTVPVPAAKGLVQLAFASFEKMAEAVPILVEQGAVACEVMDQRLIRMAVSALPRYRDLLPADARAVLLVEQVGPDAASVRDRIRGSIAAIKGLAEEVREVYDPAGQQRLWKSRTDAVPLLYRDRGRKQPVPFIEDVCVEHRHIGSYILGLEQISARHGVTFCYYGHAGDGELHVRPYLDLGCAEDLVRMKAIAEQVFELAWSLGGSISGEHADGLVRAGFVRRQYGDAYYEVLRRVKAAFDPKGILNPGKILNDDPDVMTRHLRRSHAWVRERTSSPMLFEPDELILELLQCNGCGLCRNVGTDLRMCPVFRALGDELATPRAKATILDAWATGQLSDEDFESPEFQRFLDLCIHCKACRADCPSGVDVSELITAARAEYARRRGLSLPERVLSRNRYLGLLGGLCAPVANRLMRRPVFAKALEAVAGIDHRRTMPPFVWGGLLRAVRKIRPIRPLSGPAMDRVVYFVDTFANCNDHDLGLAVLRVLMANRIEVVLPRQRPVPLPAICYGDISTARRDFAYNVKYLGPWVQQGYTIVCSEPSAALGLREELRRFVQSDDARLISAGTQELMSYLLAFHARGQLAIPGYPVEGRFLYHQPCHMMGNSAPSASIELLMGLCHVDVVDLKAGCCGLAGTFGMQKKNYEDSMRIGQGLKDALVHASNRIVLTECAACRMQIQHLCPGLTVLHPIQILARAYGQASGCIVPGDL